MQQVAFEQCKVYEQSGMSMLPMSLMLFEKFHRNSVPFLPNLTVLDPYYISIRNCIYMMERWKHATEMKGSEASLSTVI